MAQITEASERPILKSKVFLCVTEFFSGMSVMAAELGASRLLAPYFSSSQIVWTIIIGTIMIALALGAVFGGRWTDKDPNPDKLYMRIMVAAALILGMGTGTYARQLKQYYPKNEHRQRVRQWEHADGRRAEYHEPRTVRQEAGFRLRRELHAVGLQGTQPA